MKIFPIFIALLLQSCSSKFHLEGCYTSSEKLEGYFEYRLCIFKENGIYKYKKIVFSDVGGFSKIQTGTCYLDKNKLILPDYLVFDTVVTNKQAPSPDLEVDNSNFKEVDFPIKNNQPITNNVQVYSILKINGKIYLVENELIGKTSRPKLNLSANLIKISEEATPNQDVKMLPLFKQK